MSVPTSLGNLEYIRVWHDCAGEDSNAASWFLDDVVVQDLQTEEMYVILLMFTMSVFFTSVMK